MKFIKLCMLCVFILLVLAFRRIALLLADLGIWWAAVLWLIDRSLLARMLLKVTHF